MSLKITNIKMDWTDAGAVVSYEKSEGSRDLFLNCPRCSAAIKPNVEHRCGDMEVKPKQVAKKRSATKGAPAC